MKKLLKITALALGAVISFAAFYGCEPENIFGNSSTGNGGNTDVTPTASSKVLNGGFETATIEGWTVEYGDAFNDDCVSSNTFFTFADDANDNRLPINQTGNWYLTGKGFHGDFSCARTGAIRSNEFVIPADGVMSVKLAGGALTVGKGENAPLKSLEKLCYLGVYTVEDDKLIAIQHNDYFHEHTEDYVNPARYAAGVYNTDNFYEYTLDLSEYAGKSAYIRIVDNDKSWYYGYFAVDDIRLGEYADPQEEGTFFVKDKNYVQDATAPSIYEIANGDFELGSLAGWTVVSGEAFSDDGVNSESVWWNENITYNRDGNYHYGHYRPSATGVMRSSEFILGGSGYITFKLGGCADNGRTYLRIMMKTADGPVEVARYSNTKYWNFQFPYVANGMRLLNMVQYYADLSRYIGETMYIEVVDDNDSSDDLDCMTLDSIMTYHETKPVWYDKNFYLAVSNSDVMVESEYQVVNGGFETGDLTGWTLDGDIGEVTDASGWWNENLPYNKKGRYLFSGIAKEGGTGTLTSSAFTLGGCGYITYLLGGGGNGRLCYVSVIDANTGEELARYHNRYFNDRGTGTINSGSNLANMVLYKADLSEYLGRSLKIRIVDNATSYWGLMTCDSFVTCYNSIEGVPTDAKTAKDIKPSQSVLGENDTYQVLNGDFETGDLTGWSLMRRMDGSIDIGYVSMREVYWKDLTKQYGMSGTYLFSGIEDDVQDVTDKKVNSAIGEKTIESDNGRFEAGMGILESSAFTVGGCGYITFKLGGGRNANCYIEIIDMATETAIARYHNDNMSEGKLIQFKADLTAFMGRSVKIRVVDNATNDWGCLAVDDFITHYESIDLLPTAILIDNEL
ncbi:MAG: hypothetical protein J5762_02770 [Clostridia bacterium]|nr:hypothetical protein [Clostridia bacterium]